MPKLGKSRRTTTNAQGDQWRRRAEAYERLVNMVRQAGKYEYSEHNTMAELHWALLVLEQYRVIEINRELKGVGEFSLWRAVEEWKKAADSIEAIDRAADQIRGQNQSGDDLWGRPFTQEEVDADPWPPMAGDKDE